MLRREPRKVDAAPVDARRCARFQAPLRQLELLEPRRQRDRRRITRAAGRVVFEPHMHPSVEKRAGRQHHRTRMEANAHLRHNPCHSITFDDQVIAGALKNLQVRLVLQPPADRRAVQHAIGLSTGGAHGRALGAVEDAELDARLISGRRHRTAQRIKLLDQVSLADAADRRVAAHLPERLDVVREQQGGAAHARRRERGLGAGMTAADHNHVEDLGKPHGVACF